MRFTMRSACASTNCRPLRTKYVRQFWSKRRLPRIHRMAEGHTAERFLENTIRCDACPVLCYIKRGQAGACDRYANVEGQLVRVDPHILLDRAKSQGTPLVPFLEREGEWDGTLA